MPGLRPIATVTALCLALMAAPAWGRPAVMVWPTTPDAPVAEAEEALRDAGVEVIPSAPVREALADRRAEVAAADRRRRQDVEAALATSQEHFLSLELDAMIAALRSAEPDAVAVARPGRCDGLWELEFRWGLAQASRAPDADGRAALARYELALALDPERRPLGELYGPDVTAAFLEAVRRRSGRVPRAVAVRVQPPDARVELDCRALAGTEASLRPGLHAVRVSAPGFVPWSGVIDLPPGGAIEVALARPEPAPGPAASFAISTDRDPQPDGSTSAHRAILALAREAGAVAVLTVGSGSTGVRVRAWGGDGIGASVERRALEPALAAAMRVLDDEGRLVAPPAALEPGEPERPRVGERRSRPVVRAWWLWTIVGSVVVAGAGLGLGLGLREPGPGAGRLVIVAK